MAIQNTLEMDFGTELGKNHRIRIYDVSQDVSGSEVASAMDQVISSNIFFPAGGELTSKVAARIIRRETSDLVL
ncbi:DUF2922 domain-containing protein [Syntrophomonas erecta]